MPFHCTHKWSKDGFAEFKQLNVERGESPMIQDVKRLQALCNASKAKYDLNFQ